MKALPIGIENFEELVRKEYYFVDKTLLIRELLDKKSKVNLFTRPRRFGKTLNMSMIRYFFEDARDFSGNKKDYSYVFDGLNITKEEDTYLGHMGGYPVINLTLKSAKQPDFKMAVYEIYREISDEYKRHSFVKDVIRQKADRELFERLSSGEAGREEYNISLKFLTECLKNYYGKAVIVLIDEYDVPLENAYHEGFYQEMISLMRSLFESALKTNDSLEFAVITGCLRISRESIFTGLNNLNVVSILNRQYSEYFGFTEKEVKEMCEAMRLSANYEEVKDWYNGYVFGDSNIYNPWSVIMYLADHVESPASFPVPYWSNTSSNRIVRNLIERADEFTKQEIEDLITGGTVEKPIHEDITYEEVYENLDNLWNFMFFTGYFRKVSERMAGVERYLTLQIPNKEILYIFREKIRRWFEEQVRTRDLTRLHNAITTRNAAVLEEELGDILLHTISYMDANESYYHGIMAGLITGMSGYYIKSNREGGTGRSDLFVIPISRRKEAFIFEFKKAERIDRLDAAAEEALQQITEKNYRTELYDMGYDTISRYAIAFCGKDCLVKWGE